MRPIYLHRWNWNYFLPKGVCAANYFPTANRNLYLSVYVVFTLQEAGFFPFPKDIEPWYQRTKPPDWLEQWCCQSFLSTDNTITAATIIDAYVCSEEDGHTLLPHQSCSTWCPVSLFFPTEAANWLKQSVWTPPDRARAPNRAQGERWVREGKHSMLVFVCAFSSGKKVFTVQANCVKLSSTFFLTCLSDRQGLIHHYIILVLYCYNIIDSNTCCLYAYIWLLSIRDLLYTYHCFHLYRNA